MHIRIVSHLKQRKKRFKSSEFSRARKYREKLVEQKERNKELTEEINSKQQEIRDYEQSFAKSEESVEELVEEAEIFDYSLAIFHHKEKELLFHWKMELIIHLKKTQMIISCMRVMFLK